MSCFYFMKPILFTEYQKQICQGLFNHPVGTNVQEIYLYDNFLLNQFNLQKSRSLSLVSTKTAPTLGRPRSFISTLFGPQ